MYMKKAGWLLALVALIALAAVSGCSSKKTELTVSAAASLTEALTEIQGIYEKEHKDVKLLLNFGASGALQQQIEQGAAADLFLSAALKNMKALMDKGMIHETGPGDLLRNELVVVVPKGGKTAVAGAGDLAKPELKKIAIGIPESVPAGGYAKEALTAAGAWEELQPKLVQGKDVKQVLQYVETGNADAGFVYKTDALSSDKVEIAFAVDPSQYSPIVYPLGIVKETKHFKEAQQLFQYLFTPEAIAIFEKYGFSNGYPG